MKAISLFSGGLDSILATKIIKEMGIEVEAIHFWSLFSPATYQSTVKKLSFFTEKLRVFLHIEDITLQLLEKVKNPRYGYGSCLNPCIDCKILMFKKAKEYMEKVGAKFLISGEVLGERPFSQRREALGIIEKEALVKGIVLRPLSAKLLEATVPEKEGWVKREELFAMKGRSRRPQIELARKFKIYSYPSPGGGCLLTDKNFSKKLEDLLSYSRDFGVREVFLLKIGRHFRLSDRGKLIIPRNDREEQKLLEKKEKTDTLFIPLNNGRKCLGTGSLDVEDIKLASQIVASYIKGGFHPKRVKVISSWGEKVLEVPPLPSQELENRRLT